MLEQTIHQLRKEDEGASWISEWFEPGYWVKLKSNFVSLDMWYLNGWNCEVRSQWIQMEFERELDESRGKDVHHQDRRSAWRGVQGGQGECWCWCRSVECNWGEQTQAKECRRGLRSAYPVEQASMLSIMERGRRWRVWNEIEALLIDVGEAIEERRKKYRNANPVWGVPMEIEECQLPWRSTIREGGGGGVWSSPPCEIDE